jgi:hypothetical protein
MVHMKRRDDLGFFRGLSAALLLEAAAAVVLIFIYLAWRNQ